MKQLREGIKEYINFYNHQRFHQTMNYKKPMKMYNEWLKKNYQKKQNIKILRKIA